MAFENARSVLVSIAKPCRSALRLDSCAPEAVLGPLPSWHYADLEGFIVPKLFSLFRGFTEPDDINGIEPAAPPMVPANAGN
jgi:hypothetical protein